MTLLGEQDADLALLSPTRSGSLLETEHDHLAIQDPASTNQMCPPGDTEGTALRNSDTLNHLRAQYGNIPTSFLATSLMWFLCSHQMWMHQH